MSINNNLSENNMKIMILETRIEDYNFFQITNMGTLKMYYG